MKPYRFCLLLLVFAFLKCLNAWAQAPQWQWAVPENLNHQPKSIALDATGNIYVVGTALCKYNATGGLIWRKNLVTSTSTIEATGVATDAAGNIYLTGAFSSTAQFDTITLASSGARDIFLAKFNAQGKILWIRKAGGIYEDQAKAIAVDPAGNTFITGSVSIGTSVQFDSITIAANSDRGFVAKYNAQGKIQQVWLLGAVEGDEIAAGPQGSFYVSWNGNLGLSKFHANGTLAWTKTIAKTGISYLSSLGVDIAGNCFITGSFAGNLTVGSTTLTAPYFSLFLVKYDALGNEVWARQSVGLSTGQNISDYTSPEALTIDSQGHVFVTGSLFGNVLFGSTLLNTNSPDIFVYKIDGLNGNSIWGKTAGSGNNDYGKAIKALPDGSCILAGTFDGNCNFDNIMLQPNATTTTFLAKLSMNPLNAPEETLNIKFHLYPNPAISEIRIKSNFNRTASLEIFNLTGRQILKTGLEADTYLNVAAFPAGMYLVKITSEGKTETQKLVVTH